MRALIVSIAAALLGALAAWGSIQAELGKPEDPLASFRTSSTSDKPLPRLEIVGSDSFDFGTMQVFAKRRHTFQIKNTGDAPLEIHDVKTTCKCTGHVMKEGPVAPGEIRDIELEWVPKTTALLFEQSAEVLTNDPARPVIKLKIQGLVRDAISLEPGSIDLRDIMSTDPRTQEIRIINFFADPVEISRLELAKESGKDFITLESEPMSTEELSKVEDAKSGFILRVKIKPGIPLGSIQQIARVTYSLPDREPIDVPISGRVVGDITVIGRDFDSERDLVLIGDVPRGQERSSKLFIVAKGEHADATQLTIGEIDPSSSLKAELGEPVRTSGKSARWPLTLTIPTDAAPVARIGTADARLARVTIKTGRAESPEFLLRVRLSVVE